MSSTVTRLQPYVFGTVNTKGETSYAAAGLSWKFGDRFYVRPGIGIAIHNGSAEKFFRHDRIAFGSRVLFEPEVGVGARINDRLTIEASLVYLSHGQLFGGQNPGIDNVGRRSTLRCRKVQAGDGNGSSPHSEHPGRLAPQVQSGVFIHGKSVNLH